MCKLSIIIPVYNTSKYLKKCINSVLEQTNENIEILLLNDSSTDNSGEILKEFEKQNPKIVHYFEKTNGGIADTRNYGISKAKGKYILFVDSDDYIKKGLIQELDTYMEADIDLIKFKLEKVNEKGEVLERIDGPTFKKVSGKEAFNTLAFSDVLIDSPCVYAFRSNLFKDNNFKFETNTEHEDFGLIPLIILKAKSVVSIDTYGYCYVQRKNSITRNENYNRTLKRFNDVLLHYDNMINFVNKEELDEITRKNVKTYYTNAIILKLNELHESDKEIYIQKIKQRKMIRNIQVHNIKQLIKKVILQFNIKLYLKLKI